jgi:type I restriction enzyme, S subunit
MWPVKPLGRLATNSSRPFSFHRHESVVFVNTGDVLRGKFLHAKRSAKEDLPGQAKKALRRQDILLTEIRPGNGRYAYVDFDPDNYVASTKFMVIESRGEVEPRFLYHVLTNQSALDEFQQIAESRSGTFPQITFESIAHYPVPVPSKRDQKRIASLLDTFEFRLSLLRETNATFEAIAQALFKSWFVNFDPVRAKMEGRTPDGMDEATAALFPERMDESELGLVPKGWRARRLGDAFDINPTRRLKKGAIAPYLDMASLATSGHCVERPAQREMGSGAKFRNGDSLLARITPCLENGKAAFVDFLADDQIGWGSTEFLVLRPKSPLPEYFGYLLCRHPAFRDHAIQSMSGTSGRQRIQNDSLGRYLLAIPDSAVASAFAALVGPIQACIATNHGTAKTLSTLRDTLLPRLVSGRLRLSEVEERVGSAVAVP